MPQADALKRGLRSHFSASALERLGRARIGIAGCGGLGSNAAMLLARSGIEDFILIDHDLVDASNLNRQHYWPRHLGQPKVLALAESLRELNPQIRLDLRCEMLSGANLAQILPEAGFWLEALDAAPSKKLFVETALLAGCEVVAASGLAGVGGEPMRMRRLGRLTLVGDFVTDVSQAPPLAPRVSQAAALLADAALARILGEEGATPERKIPRG